MKRKPARSETKDQKPERTPGTNDAPDVPRITATFFQFWLVCAQPRCRRSKACVGDAQACFDRCWPHVPEDMKNWLRFSIKARQAGMTPLEASRHAEAEVARWNEIERSWTNDRNARVAPVDITPPPALDAAPLGPRIRRL